MRSLRPALLSAVLLVTILPSPTGASGTPSPSAPTAAPTASSDAVLAAGSGTDLITDITGFYVAGGAGASYTPVDPVRLLDTRSGNGLDEDCSGTACSL